LATGKYLWEKVASTLERAAIIAVPLGLAGVVVGFFTHNDVLLAGACLTAFAAALIAPIYGMLIIEDRQRAARAADELAGQTCDLVTGDALPAMYGPVWGIPDDVTAWPGMRVPDRALLPLSDEEQGMARPRERVALPADPAIRQRPH
jgi:hypothetical protein